VEAIKPIPEMPQRSAGLLVLSVVVPTFSERGNVAALYRKLEAALDGIAWEIVFVDDNSPDNTWDVVRGVVRQDPRVRCIRRIGGRGLSGACIEGILACSAPYAAVMDADLQHDQTQLPRMLSLLQSAEAELVVGICSSGASDEGDKVLLAEAAAQTFQRHQD
jgi:dolichol-phosphate mannosyltransferase